MNRFAAPSPLPTTPSTCADRRDGGHLVAQPRLAESQLFAGELPCPLCLLERLCMFGIALGVVLNLRAGVFRPQNGPVPDLRRAVLMLIIAVRQTLLDIYPRPGHAYIGSAILGLHMPVWVGADRHRHAGGLCAETGRAGGVTIPPHAPPVPESLPGAACGNGAGCRDPRPRHPPT